MAERAPVSSEETLVRYDNPVLVTKRVEKVVSNLILFQTCLFTVDLSKTIKRCMLIILLIAGTSTRRVFYTAMCANRSQKGNRRDTKCHFATKGMGRRWPNMDSKGAAVSFHTFALE